ncbi:MAG: ferritin [Methanosarcinaceae archaeon]|nr:ferritin [Methanosarcinaceae archaeon]
MAKISKKMEKALNEQINKEFSAAFLYLSMSAYFENRNLSGFAHWMKMQYHEEVVHVMKIFDFIHDRGGKAEIMAIDAVKSDWKDEVEVFKDTFAHEMKVTESINKLVKLSHDENDYATGVMLQWFVTEQVEEEASAAKILEKLKLIDGAKAGLMMIDNELMSRAK